MNFLSITKDELSEIVHQAVSDALEVSCQSSEILSSDYLTRKQAAEILHISLPTLRKLTLLEELPPHRVLGRVLYKRADIDKVIANSKKDYS